ncbi:MAG: squalene--hopene cyclase, partial [Cyanobacteria bacterium J06600_6]
MQAKVKDAIASSQNYLLSIQESDGHWCAELESNVTITAEVVLLHKIWGTYKEQPVDKIEAYLRLQQREHGGWELYYGDGGELSTTVEAYMALRLLGVTKEDPALLKAQKFIVQHGGISKTRIFTKMHLALIGCYDWAGLPSIPPSIMLLPEESPFTIYEMSSWARGSTVPLLIVFDRKPIFKLDRPINLDELYAEGVAHVRYELPRSNDWTDIFVAIDSAVKVAEEFNLVPWREEGLAAAEKWVIERQEVTGDWGGIIPAMLNSMLALKVLDYDLKDPIVQRGLTAIDNFAIETKDRYCVQPCVSPVWDTAWCIRALAESGLGADHSALVKAGKWLLDKQILDYGDWAVKNKAATPGGWAFEYDNRFYPDVDDSAVVVMALSQLKLSDERQKQKAIARCLNWIASMQCKPGGWAAFDLDNDQDWINQVPYGDLKAMIDPNTADVTARVLEMLGECNLGMDDSRVQKAIAYLAQEQESDGSWFGRWGVNYIYGTSGVLAALSLIAPMRCQSLIERGANWLVSCQNADGGWGETCASYDDENLKGTGISTASQTSWALLGIMAAKSGIQFAADQAIERGIEYLLNTQQPGGTWDEDQFTGTGFPCHFYLKYHLYQQYFPLQV